MNPISFLASIHEFGRMKRLNNPRLVLDVFKIKDKEERKRILAQLVEAEYGEYAFQVTLTPLKQNKEEKEQDSDLPESDELSKELSDTVIRYCQVAGHKPTEIFERLRGKHKTLHLRLLDDSTKQGIIDLLLQKIAEIETPKSEN